MSKGIMKFSTYQVMPQQEKIKYLNDLVKTQSDLISRTLPNRNQIERFLRSLTLTIGSANQKLLDCTPYSILTSSLNLAYFGLDPSPYLGHGYLVPYKTTATLIIGYKGYVYLMLKSGLFSAVNAEVVHENDEFSLQLGMNRQLTHSPVSPSDQGEVKGAYTTLNYKEGYQDFCFMWLEEINKIRDNSLGYYPNNPSGPWKDHPDEMRKKTTTRRIIKLAQFPVGDDRFRIAAEVDGAQEAGKQLLQQELNVGAIKDADGNWLEPDPEPTKDNEVTIDAEVTETEPTRARPGKEEKITPEVKTGKSRLDGLIKEIGEHGVDLTELYTWFKDQTVKTEKDRIGKIEEALELLEGQIPWSAISAPKTKTTPPETDPKRAAPSTEKEQEKGNNPDWMKTEVDPKETNTRAFVAEQWAALRGSDLSFVCKKIKDEFPTLELEELDDMPKLQFSIIEALGGIIMDLPGE